MTRYANPFDIEDFYSNLKITIQKSDLTKPIPPSVQINILNTTNYSININSEAFNIIPPDGLLANNPSGGRMVTHQFFDDMNRYLTINKIVLRNRIALKPMIIQNYLRDFNIFKIPIYYENCVFLRKKLQKDLYRDCCENCIFV